MGSLWSLRPCGGPAARGPARSTCGIESRSQRPTCARSPARPSHRGDMLHGFSESHVQPAPAVPGGQGPRRSPRSPGPRGGPASQLSERPEPGDSHTHVPPSEQRPHVLDSLDPKSVFQSLSGHVPAGHSKRRAEKIKDCDVRLFTRSMHSECQRHTGLQASLTWSPLRSQPPRAWPPSAVFPWQMDQCQFLNHS